MLPGATRLQLQGFLNFLLRRWETERSPWSSLFGNASLLAFPRLDFWNTLQFEARGHMVQSLNQP